MDCNWQTQNLSRRPVATSIASLSLRADFDKFPLKLNHPHHIRPILETFEGPQKQRFSNTCRRTGCMVCKEQKFVLGLSFIMLRYTPIWRKSNLAWNFRVAIPGVDTISVLTLEPQPLVRVSILPSPDRQRALNYRSCCHNGPHNQGVNMDNLYLLMEERGPWYAL